MRKILFLALLLVVIVIGLLHFFTPGHLVFYHETYRRLSYFPIVLGAIWFGVSGGLALAILSSIAFIPHVLLYVGRGFEHYLSELTEIILYLAAGTVTGIIAGRESRLRKQYKLLSEKLERSYTRLHKETEQLIEAEEQLAVSQKLSALGQLSASLAHEIKNPLSSIKGTAEILLDDFPEDHPKREFVEILRKEAARLNNTVEEVLRYSRGQRGKEESTEPLSGVISRTVKLLDSRLRDKSIQFNLIGQEQGDTFYVVGDKISQVVLNIMLNAIDAVVPKKGKISLEVIKEAQGCSIIFADNGPGVPDSDKDYIFNTFFSGKEDGTGLGLVISRKIIESYGGSITITDSEEGGACFTVFLPEPGQDEIIEEIVSQ